MGKSEAGNFNLTFYLGSNYRKKHETPSFYDDHNPYIRLTKASAQFETKVIICLHRMGGEELDSSTAILC